MTLPLPRLRFTLLLFVVAVGPALAGPQYLMAALGDSGTVGLSAETPFEGADPAATIATWGRLVAVMAAPGNVRLLRRDPSGRLVPARARDNRYRYSWATGAQIPSQAVRLAAYLGESQPEARLDVLNAARVGAKTVEMAGQAREIVRLFRAGRYDALKYVVILTGVNDLAKATGPEAGMTDDAALTAGLRAVLAELASIEQAEPVRVLVVPVPNLADIGDPRIRAGHVLLPGLTHERLRRYHGFARYWAEWRTPEEYAARSAAFRRKLEAFRRAVDEVRATYPASRIDPVYARAMEGARIDFACLSVDGCHPSKEGQIRLAAAAWAAQPWFRLACPAEIGVQASGENALRGEASP